MELNKDTINETPESENTEVSSSAEDSSASSATENESPAAHEEITEAKEKMKTANADKAPKANAILSVFKKKTALIVSVAVVAVAAIVTALILLLGGHEHSPSEPKTVNLTTATCTAAGSYDSVVYCLDCDEIISSEKVTLPATGHKGGTATCEALAVCTECNENYGELKSHDYADATCTAPKTCKVCAATDGIAKAHSYSTSVIDPTCTESGYTVTKCTNEGCTYESLTSYVPALDHKWSEPTCEHDRTCERCVATQPKLPCNYVKTGSTEATCNAAATETFTCSYCQDEYTNTVGTALSHDINGVAPTEVLVNGCTYKQTFLCKREGCNVAVDGESFEKHNLKASITKEATCSEEGVKTLACTQCDYYKTEAIAKNTSTGHSWTSGTVQSGKRTDTCSGCSATKTVTVYTGTDTGSTKAENFKDAEIELNGANISMDSGVVDSIGNKDITLSAGKLEGDDRLSLGLDADKLAQVGNSPIYNFTIKDGANQAISSFGENNFVTITLPYTLSEGEDVDNIAIWFISDTGELESIEAEYNNGFVTFKTNHFSYYTVTRLNAEQRCNLYGHNWAESVVAPTCMADGYTLKVCTRCHTIENTDVKAALGHSFNTEETDATCTENGKVVSVCENCKASTITVIPAIGHDFEETARVDATCEAPGEITYTCANCTASYVEKLAQLGHSFTATVTEPDCENGGYTYNKCDNCEASYISDETSALGHNYTVSFSWAEDKKSAAVLLNCTNNAEHTSSIPADVSVNVIEATCSGGTIYEYTATITVNGKTYTDMATVTEGEPNHVFSAEWKANDGYHWYECICGAKNELAAHDFGNGEITTEPTCTEAGEKTFTCVCGKAKTEEIPSAGSHSYEVTAHTDATCTAEGCDVYTCSACGDSYTDTILKIAHILTESVIDPTCESVGYKLTQCENCSFESKTEETAALGHNYEAAFIWSVDYSSAKVKLACKNDTSHVTEIDATVIVDSVDASCYGGAVDKFTASVTVNSVIYTDTKIISSGTATHSFSAEWKSNGTHHWHECVCGEKKDVTSHSFKNGTVTQDPTCTATGIKTFTCECGKTKTETVPANGIHEYINGACKHCGAAEPDCTHEPTERGLVDLSDYGFCHGVVAYYSCKCGEVKLLDEDNSDIECDSDYVDMVREEIENGMRVSAKLICEDCGMCATVEGIMIEDDCHSTEKITYSFYEKDFAAPIVIDLSYEDSYYDHDYRSTTINVACGGSVTVSKCRTCGTVDSIDDFDLGCEGSLSMNDIEPEIQEDDYFYGHYEFECDDCGLKLEIVFIGKAENCKTSMYYRYYLSVGDETICDYVEEEYYFDHDYDESYEMLGESCEDGVRVYCTCADCGDQVYYYTFYHRTNEIREIDLSEYSDCYGFISGTVCEICGLITYVEHMELDCEMPSDVTPEELYINGKLAGYKIEYTCADCGLRIYATEINYNETSCKHVAGQTVMIYSGSTCIFNYTEERTSEKHDYEYEVLEMLGDCCEDGVKLYVSCKNCEYNSEKTSYGHYTVYEEKDFSESGMCGGTFESSTCAICGYVERFYAYDYYCVWQSKGTNSDGYEVYQCTRCNATRWQKETKGEKDDNCYYTVERESRYYMGGTLIISGSATYTETQHNYVIEYVFTGNKQNCEDGVKVYKSCTDCNYSRSNEYTGHISDRKAAYDLSEYGGCGGTIYYYACPCGSSGYFDYEVNCMLNSNGGSYIENGVTYYAETTHCSICDFYLENFYYCELDQANCVNVQHHTCTITVGDKLVDYFTYVKNEEYHDDKIDYRFNGNNCEDGYDVIYTCKICGDVRSGRGYGHSTFETRKYDLSDYGATCGGYLIIRECPCGERREVIHEASCKFDYDYIDCWVDGAIYGWHDDEYFEYDFYDMICPVTSPSCGFTVRYAKCFIPTDGCLAEEVEIFLLGYNEATGSYKERIEFKTGEVRFCHQFSMQKIEGNEDGFTVTGTKYTCACGSYRTEKEYRDAAGTLRKVVSERKNTNAVGSLLTYYSEGYENDANGNRTYSYSERGYANGTKREEEYYYLTYGMSCFTKSYYECYTYANGSTWWYRLDNEYDFSDGCKVRRTYIYSDGDKSSYIEDCHIMTDEITKIPTCTQPGVRSYSCIHCDYYENSEIIDPISHEWYAVYDKSYVCACCGLENANGASGNVVMEDLTASYGNGDYYVVGYYLRKPEKLGKFVDILVNGKIIPLDESKIAILDHDTITAYLISKADIAAQASALGYNEGEYNVVFSLVPTGASGNLDYAITFSNDYLAPEDKEITDSCTFSIYADKGEIVEYVLTVDEYSNWKIRSFTDGDTKAYLYNSDGALISENDDGGYGNNFCLDMYLDAGTYTLVIKWFDSEKFGFINVSATKTIVQDNEYD